MSFLFRKRKSMGAEQGRLAGVPTPAGIQSMDESLQKKFAKGIQFNIKILIRGDRNTGKTCLFHRMQGKQFTEAYIPTNEIQVTSILWSYRVTNDTVKVEIWDIVDKGRSQKKTGKSLLKMFNEPSTEEDPTNVPLDAEFMDVYKGAHGVVFTFDITKQWTWKYIERELPKVPLHIPIIILGNFRDMGEHRVVSRDEAVLYIHGLDRPDGAAPVRYAESSMKNGFGLMHLHKFLSVPFLQLQQETLLQQLQVNREQSLAAKEELDSAEKLDDQNYNMFFEKLQRLADEKKRKPAPPLTPDNASSVGSGSPRLPPRGDTVESVQEDATSPVGESQQSGSLSSRLFSGFLSRNKEAPKKEEIADSPAIRKPAMSAMKIDDFVPEGGEVESFLEDSDKDEEEEDSEEDSDDDVDGGNPQVAMDEDLSSPEEEVPPVKTTPLVPEVKKQPKSLKSANEIVLTESEESDEPAVMEDEDVNLEELAITPKKEPTPEKKVFNNVPLEQLFEVPQKKATKAKKKSKKAAEEVTESGPVEQLAVKPPKKSSGLMLEFSPAPPPTSKPNPTPPEAESPVLKSERRDSKRKKSKKKKETEPVKSEGVSEGGAKETSSDPFGAIASLDAWLNSDSTGKEASLESSWSTHKPSTVVVGEEADSTDEEVEKKPKKHKHRRHREEEERTRKKKHKHKSSSRHRTEEEDRNYGVL